MKRIGPILVTASLALANLAHADTNYGLVGIGEISQAATDTLHETMGGFFSGMCWDPRSETLYGLADRGPLNGEVDYRPRVQAFQFAINLKDPSLRNITLTLKNTILLRDKTGNVFSGADADDRSWTNFPRTAAGVRALDAEGLVRAPDGTFWISEEYGPFLYHFDSEFHMWSALVPPNHVLPKVGPFGSRKINFTAAREPDTGREKNHGFEGIGLTPDGKTLFALLQTACVQDSLNGEKINKASRNARLFTWDITNPAEPKLTGEYIYQMDLLPGGKLAMAQSEILVVNTNTFLVLERDSFGRGTGKPKEVCRVYRASLNGATNLQSIPGTPYSREAGDPQGIALSGPLPAAITPLSKALFVDMLNPAEFAKAGYSDLRELPEKWEGLSLVEQPGLPPGHCLLLIGVDNDFKTRHGFFKTAAHEDGESVAVVDRAATEVPTLLFAYHVELTGYVAPFNNSKEKTSR